MSTKGNGKKSILHSSPVLTTIAAVTALSCCFLASCSPTVFRSSSVADSGVSANTVGLDKSSSTDISSGAVSAGASSEDTSSSAVTSPSSDAVKEDSQGNVVYTNQQYGFTFTLPADWKDFTIVSDTWQGYTSGDSGSVTVASGPLLSLRSPKWTEDDPTQDIPLMIYTLDQWDSLQNGNFYVSAAPINPTELDRNSTYVFALPARYNYAFPTGYEEVDQIMQGNPLKPMEIQ